jgi:PAC2 family
VPAELFELLGHDELGKPVLVEALGGVVDAGSGVSLASGHLLRSFPGEPVAVFDVDTLHDYRARRPLLTFSTDHWSGYEPPELVLHVLRDAAGTSFLLLAGAEPDVQWERAAAASLQLIERLDVQLTVGLQAIPWALPHTRPAGVISHGTPGERLLSPPLGVGDVKVPASFGQFLQYRLAQTGRDAIGLAARVPYYLAHVEYPPAAESLLVALEQVAGLSLSLDSLRAAAAKAHAEVNEQLRGDEQATAIVRELEAQYDAAIRSGTSTFGERLPTGDELGAAFEQFLAERPRPEPDE